RSRRTRRRSSRCPDGKRDALRYPVGLVETGGTHMGGLSLWHWLVVLVIVVLVFGTKPLKNVGHDLGEAVRGFKKGLHEDDKPADDTRADSTQGDDDGTPPSRCTPRHGRRLRPPD